MEEEYVDLDWTERSSTTSKPLKLKIAFDSQEKEDQTELEEGSGQVIDDDEDLLLQQQGSWKNALQLPDIVGSGDFGT